MISLSKTIFGAALCLFSLSAVAAEAEKPIISFHTILYDEQQENNAFHFYLGATEDIFVDVDYGFGPVEVEVKQATFDGDTQAMNGTVITGTVSSAGDVKIYGDASKIDYFDCEGVYITDLEMSSLVNLEIVNLAHNQLKRLDLTPHAKLQSIDITDNPFNESPAIIGAPKPDLAILTIENVGAIDQSLSLRDYPALLSFDAYHCPSLKVCDPTGCPDLLRLSLDISDVETLDVSKNPNLLILNIAQTKIRQIDLSNNKYLTEFYCGHVGSYNSEYTLSAIDLSHCPDLQRLACEGNELTTLDISANTRLSYLNCSRNKLTGINFDNNPDLYSVNVSNNYMDFATLPANRLTFSEYYYYQHEMSVDRSYPVGATMDFASRVLRPESETYAGLFAPDPDDNGAYMELGDEYISFKDGKVELLKSYPDSVYLMFANTALPDYSLTTAHFMIKEPADFGKDVPAVAMRLKPTAKTLTMSVGMDAATSENPKSFSVDFGDGVPVEFKATTWQTPDVPNVSGAKKGIGNIVIYTPEGTDITALAIDNVPVSTINLDTAPLLRQLSLTNTGLGAVSLKWNRCLTSLDLSDNALTSLDLTGANSSNGKNVLTDIRASNNKIASVTLSDGRTPLHIDLSHNMLTEFSLENSSRLLSLDLSHNSIAALDLEDCEALSTLDISYNELESLPIPVYTPLADVDLRYNRIALVNLPAVGSFATYRYAPQKEWLVPEIAPTVNLSSQWLDVDGKTTQFTWRTADTGRELTEAEIAGSEGYFRFPDPSVGKVYCSWTHPAFPDFTGEDVYRTTVVETAPVPEHVVASFTTLTDGKGTLTLTARKKNSSVYVDWSGHGALEQYILSDTYTVFEGETHAGETVKVYSYDEDDGLTVFSLSAGQLADIDATSMKSLVAFACYGAGLTADKIGLPQSAALRELGLGGNRLTDAAFGAYTELTTLELNSNNITELDLTAYPKLQCAYASNNEITFVKLSNPALWELSLVGNELSAIDLSGVPAMNQLWLSDNDLETIDVSALKSLQVLAISGNRFTFVTLPPVLPSYYLYEYANQQPLEAEVIDGKVDLSDYLKVGEVTTQYRWFIDTPYYNENDELVGEELYEGEEYTLENGVTTFLDNFTHIMCVLTNASFPKLVLYTDFVNVENVGVGNVSAGEGLARFTVDGRDIKVCANADSACALYSADGSLVMSGTTAADGCYRFGNLMPGLYIARCGASAAKLMVR